MTNKILSIIIPTYNMEAYIGRCLNSVCQSEHIDDIEVIAVNDGSKDNSLSIIEQYAKQYPQSVVVIDKKNGNYGSCINAGLQIANGKYIKVLDADDWFDTISLSKYIEHLGTIDADVSITSFEQVDTQGNLIRKWSYAQGEPLGGKSVDDFFAYSFNLTLPMHRIAYKRDLLINMQYRQTEGISYTDSEWAYKPMLRAQTVDVSDISVYRYVLGRDGQTMDPKVILRSLSQENILIESLASDRNAVKDKLQGNLSAFADFVICRKAIFIYTQMLLIASNEQFDANIVRQLEVHLQNLAPDLYERMATFDARCFVVRKWRKSNKRYNTILRKLIVLALNTYKRVVNNE